MELHGTLLREGASWLDTGWGRFRLHRFRNLHSGKPALALVAGDPGGAAPLLARVHSSCLTSEALGALDCDCAEQLGGALERLAAEGRGVLFYLLQEGRGAGFAAKARDRMWVQASRERITTFEAYEAMGLGRDRRRYDEVAFLRRLLGIEAPLSLLTNNPEKAAAVAAEKVPVAGVQPLRRAPSRWNHHYLASKHRSGHSLVVGAAPAPSALPAGARVERLEPEPWDEAGRFLRIAAYLLPVAAPDAAQALWLRLHLFYDRTHRCERIVLAFEGDARAGDGPAPVRVQPERLDARFRAAGSPARRSWQATLREFRRAGAGVALLAPDEEGAPVDAATLRLLAAPLRGRRALPLVAEAEDSRALEAALAAGGVRVEAARRLR